MRPATVGAWLASRMPPPPDVLRSRILLALGDSLDEHVADTDGVCLDAAERVLARLFGGAGAGRNDAADLLAADALVTYALEFAADSPEHFGDRAARAIARFGRLYEAHA